MLYRCEVYVISTYKEDESFLVATYHNASEGVACGRKLENYGSKVLIREFFSEKIEN